MLKLFDSHAHYNDPVFTDELDGLLTKIYESGVTRVMNVSYDMESSEKTVALCGKYGFLYGAVGVHPHDSKDIVPSDYDRIKTLCENEKIRAIGETGLDYHYDNSPRDIQKREFDNHLSLAKELGLPVIVHERDAVKDTLDIIKAHDVCGIYHCFSGSVETAREALKKGYYISFSGVVTFKNAKHVKEAAAYVPNDRILIETDCPYLSPVPKRGERNSSLNLIYTLNAVAEIRGISPEKAAEMTFENAERIFGAAE